jgi:hypothetical protein
MILRRLYLLFPERSFALRGVEDLREMGVEPRHIHTIAKPGVNTEGLPEASLRQRSDLMAQLDHWIWDINLLIFFFALAISLIAVWSDSWAWFLGGVLVMIATFSLGNHYAKHVPHAHLSECQTALRHGEILLMVDLPRWQMGRVEKTMRRQHPEIEVGGVSWVLDALGI